MPMTRSRYLMLQSMKNKPNSMVKSGFRLVLTPHFEKNSSMTRERLISIDRLNESIEFDVVNGHSINASSTITTYPIVDGDTVADHMIRQPTSITINGVFSLYGNKPTLFSGNEDRLTNIETYFERIKDEGVMCTLVTMERGGGSSSKQRFKVRNNMVLTNINWTEGQSDIKFSFTFTEALTVNLDDIEIDYTDENLPAITNPATLDFTDTLINWEEVDKIVIKQLHDLGLCTDDFLIAFQAYVKDLGEVGLSGLIGGAVGAGLAIALVTAFSIPVAGWIAAGVGFLVGAFVAMFQTAKRKKAEKEYGIKTFKAYKNDRKNQQECERFVNYIGNIHRQMEYLEDVIQVYGIGSNQEQECILYVDNSYYIFSFKKNNTQTENGNTIWTCNITDVEETINKDVADVAAEAMSSIDQCTTSNMLFRTQTGGGFWVYLINKDLFEIENATYTTEEERQKAINECNSNLTSFCVMVSQTNMDDFNDNLSKIVIDAMKM